MATPIYKYYTEFYRNITDCNDRKGAPFSNENIRDAIRRFIVEEEAHDHNEPFDTNNITVDTFSQTPVIPNTQGKNENTILTRREAR